MEGLWLRQAEGALLVSTLFPSLADTFPKILIISRSGMKRFSSGSEAQKSWRQEFEAASCIPSAAGETNDLDMFHLSFMFSPGPQPMKWCHLHSAWAIPHQRTHSKDNLTGMSTAVSSK